MHSSVARVISHCQLLFHHDCVRLKHPQGTADGANPCSLSLPALRQAAAKEAGISPMLEPDEILAAFIKYLASKSPGTGGAGASGSAGDAKGASAGAVDANKVWLLSPPQLRVYL